MVMLWAFLACVEEEEPAFVAEGCEAAEGEELLDATISGTLAADTGDHRTVTEVVVTTADWTVTFSDGDLTSDSDHCDCTSEAFGYATTSESGGAELQRIVAGGSMCFRNTTACGQVELIGAGVAGGGLFLYVSGLGDLACEEG